MRTAKEDIDNNDTGDVDISGLLISLMDKTTGLIVGTSLTDSVGKCAFVHYGHRPHWLGFVETMTV